MFQSGLKWLFDLMFDNDDPLPDSLTSVHLTSFLVPIAIRSSLQ